MINTAEDDIFKKSLLIPYVKKDDPEPRSHPILSAIRAFNIITPPALKL